MKRSEINGRPLADTTLAGLEPEGAAYREHGGQGLYFRVKPNGGKSNQTASTPAGNANCQRHQGQRTDGRLVAPDPASQRLGFEVSPLSRQA
jgi:hypothetical protein